MKDDQDGREGMDDTLRDGLSSVIGIFHAPALNCCIFPVVQAE